MWQLNSYGFHAYGGGGGSGRLVPGVQTFSELLTPILVWQTDASMCHYRPFVIKDRHNGLLSSQVSDKVYLKGICFEGVHNRYRLNVDFNESLSILHGQNGTGKTTLLHAIANIANCDF